jgi:hypothetical protein
MRVLTLATAFTIAKTAALADVQVAFRDGAPKDTFTISNLAECATGPMMN